MKTIRLLFLGFCFVALVRLAPAAEMSPGLLGEYFDVGESNDDIPKLAPSKKPVITRVDKQINFRSTGPTFPDTKLTNYFAIRWTGKIKIPKDGKYTFFLESDDGSRLLIDGKAVVENGGLHDMQEQMGDVELKTGEHEIRIDYFENENSGEAGCVLSWKSKEMPRAAVPASALSHETKPER